MSENLESTSNGKRFTMSPWSVIGGVALAAFAYVVIASIPDIKRYIRISQM